MNIVTVDLENDAQAVRVQKSECVSVSFATEAGELQSREGPNKYGVGDAVVQSAAGDRWVVNRPRFEAKYEAVAPTIMGCNGAYMALPQVVLAKLMHTDFSLHRKPGGDLLHGRAGDWVLQYALNDFGVCEKTRFAQVYVKVGA